MRNSKISILLLIVVMIFAISAASAAEIDDTSDSDALAVDETTVGELVFTNAADDIVETVDEAKVLADPGDGDNFTALQYKLDNVGTNPIVYIEKDYTKALGEDVITISKDVAIIARGGDYKIDANGVGGIFKINTGVTVYINGITFVNGNSNNGGAIYNDGDLTIGDCTFSNNVVTGSGGAIYTTTELIANNCVFMDNDITTRNNAERDGGAIYAEGSSLTVTNSKFTGNIKNYIDGVATGQNVQGGAIATFAANTLIDNCEFTDNAGFLGSAIVAWTANRAGVIIVNNSKFENNHGYQGGAIFAQSLASLTVDNSEFTGNYVTATETPGKQTWSSGGAIDSEVKTTITNSNFTANSAQHNGGAVYIQPGNNPGVVDNCRFEDNTAGAWYGALYYSGSNTLTVTNSYFNNNDAPKASAIGLLGGKLELSNNTIADDEEILLRSDSGYSSSIISQIKVVILNNSTETIYEVSKEITAKITDDNDNIISNIVGIKFVTDGAEVAAVYNETDKLYYGVLALANPGIYIINATYNEDMAVETATIKNYRGTFKDLQTKVDDATTGTLDLEYDFTYTPELGDDAYVNGVVISNALTINGNGYTISGSNAARIFRITAATTLNNVTIADGYYTASYGGAAIYATAPLTVTNSNFTNNGAEDLITKSVYGAVRTSTSASFDNCVFTNNYGRWGGAIGAEGSGTITITDSKFENNHARQGGAIDIEGYTLNIENTEFIANEATVLGGAIHTSLGTVATISNSKFENNNGYQGGAIAAKGNSGSLTIDDSEFIGNEVYGTEMPGSSTWSSGGAIWSDLAITVTDSNFTDNYAEYNGGAIYIQPTTAANAVIDNCRFVDNSAGANYGALVYLGSATMTVSDSYFDNNNVNGQPNAITLNGGKLALSGNTIEGISPEILIKSGTAISQINITVMDNVTHNFSYKAVDLYAAITDDNGNVITDSGFKFLVGTDEVAATFNPETKYYEATYAPAAEEEYLVSMNYAGTATLDIKTATISFTRSLIDIQNMIDAAEEGDTITLDGDYKYVEELDADVVNGVVIDKAITINGNGYTISGSNSARIFNVTAPATLANITFVNGSAAEFGGAIYTTADLTVSDSVFDNNNIVSQATTGEFGGSAIFADKGTTLTIKGSSFTNNNKDYVNGEQSYGAVAVANNAIIEDSYFANNYARWGGAVTSVGYLDNDNKGTLTIRNTKFENNKALMGGAVFSQVADLVVLGSEFNSNEAQDGGAILADDYRNNLYTTTIEDSSFDSNKATRYGSAINQLTAFTYTGTNFTNNQAPSGTSTIHYMGSLEDAGFEDSVIDDCRFEDNTAAYYGAVYFYGTKSLDITNSKFINNQATQSVGAVFFYGDNLNVETSEFTSNKGKYAGAIYVNNGNEITIDDSKFNDNTGDWAGAIFINNGAASVSNSEFAGNIGQYANAIMTATSLSLKNNTINTAKADIYAYTANGVIISEVNVIILDNETVTMNGKKVITAKITDDNDNVIRGANFKFDINGNELTATYTTAGTYQATYTNDVAGIYLVNITYPEEDNLIVKTAVLINIKGTFTDLQNQINAAEDELNLTYNFTYVEGIDDATLKEGVVISNPLTINGNGYTISGNNVARVFKINAATTLNNVTIADGYVTANGGAAILATAELTVTNTNFTSNHAPLEGTYGAVATTTSASFDNCVFTDNSGRWGGAIGAEGSGTITVKDSKFEDNYARQGAAMDIEGYTLIVENCEFNNNEATTLGSAIHTSQGTATTIKDSKFENNIGYQGGAIAAKDSGSLTIDNTLFNANEVYGTEMPDSQTWSSAGAIWSEVKMTISNTNFTNNYAEYNGAAIYYYKNAYVGTSLIENCIFENNKAGSYYGAVYYNGWDNLNVKNSNFTNNTANNGAGAIHFTAQKLTVEGGEFTDNTGNQGGAIYFNNRFSNFDAQYQKLTVTGATFEANTAKDKGGAIYINNGEPSISDSTFDGNTANGEANAIYLNAGNLALSGNTIVGKASEIVNNNGAITTKLNATILDNKTWNDTGLGDIYILNATLTDDMGNSIYDADFRFTVDGTVINDVPTYDAEKGLYQLGLYMDKAALRVISTNYEADNLEIYPGALEIVAANVTKFTVEVADIIDGENATVKVTLIGVNDIGLNETVRVIINNKPVAITVTDGVGEANITDLAHGSYPVVAEFNSNLNYNPALNSTVFYVKATTTITIAGPEEDVVYGEPVTIKVTVTTSDEIPFSGLVYLGYYETEFAVVINAGEGSYTFDANTQFLSAGVQEFRAVYEGNNDYNASESAPITFNVIAKEITEADLYVSIYGSAPENVTVYIEGPVGTYNVTVDDQTVQVDVKYDEEEGYAYGEAEIAGLTVGDKEATITIDDDNYIGSITETFEYKNVPDFNVTITGTYPNAEITIEGTDGTYSVYIDEGHQYVITVKDGIGSESVSGLFANDYVAYVVFEQEGYYGVDEYVDFTVNKAALDIAEPEVIGDTVVESPINITFILPAGVDPSTVSAFMDGVPVPIDEFVINETTGVYTLPLDGFSSAGGHLFTVEVNDPNYEEDGAQVTFTIEKAETTVTIEVDGDLGVTGGATVNVTVSNNAEGYIAIDNNGVVSVVEITNGTYSFEIYDLTAGEYYINVTFLGNDKYLKSNATKVLNIPKSSVTPEITDVTPDETLGKDVLIFVDMNNDLVSGNVTVFVDGVENQTVALDEDYGMAIVTIPGLTIGDHTIGVKYNGDDNFNASDIVTLTVNIGKADSKVTIDPIDNVTYGEEVFILYAVENQTNVKITIFHADEIIDPEMETADGIIAIKGLTPGDYQILIENEESDEYKVNWDSALFTVGKAASSVTIIDIDDLVYPGSGEVLYIIENKTGEQSVIVTFNGNEIVVPYDDESIQLTDLAAGEYTITIINLEDDLYNESEASISFKVLKADPTFTSNVTEDAKVGENVTITVKAPVDATGNVTVTVDGEIVAVDVPVINGVASVNVTGLAAGHHSYMVTYGGDDNYEIASDLNSFDVVKNTPEIIIADIENPVVGNTVQTTVTVADGDATGYVIYNNVAYKLENGKATIDVGISEAGTQIITVEYLGDDKYSNGTGEKAFTAAKAPTTIDLKYSEITEVLGRDVEIDYTIDPMVGKGNVTVWINDVLYSNEEIYVSSGAIIISADDLPTNGTYTVKVQYIGTKDYEDSNVATVMLNITDEHVDISVTVPENTTTPVFNITVPTDATGLLLVDIDGKHYYAPIENGTASITVPALEPGNYTANVTYTGDDFYDGATKTVEFTVPANADENSITIPEGATTTNPTFSINLPSDATGYFEVDVDGKKYVVPVENGTASISVPGLAAGDHNVTVKYSGDSKYNSISKSTTLNLKEPVAKLSKNKYIKVVYSAKATYKVLLTLDGKAAAGKYVKINFNGKNYNVKTDSKGYATLKLNTKVKPKKYTVTATYKGVKVTSKVKVKHVIKAKNKKAKKSKKLKIKVKLKKVNGKVLKNKKVKLKFKGKKYTAKTNKKGKATFTIKKKVMKKLKKGKKYKYKVYYGKDKVTKKIKVKK